MRAERWIFVFLFLFFAVMTAIYGLMTAEVIGIFVLLLAALLCGMVAFYVWAVGRKIDPRPEDDKNGEILQGAGPLGFFPPKSIWPFWIALTIGVIMLGPVFGWWVTILGVGLGIWATCGLVFEYYRGDYAH